MRIKNYLYEELLTVYCLEIPALEILMSYSHSKKQKILIRIPMISEVPEVIQYADISFNSELKTDPATWCGTNKRSCTKSS